MRLSPTARKALYTSFQELGAKIRTKNNERQQALNTVSRIDSEILSLTHQRKEIIDHALTCGENFEIVEQDQRSMAAMDRAEYDPMRG